MVYPFLRSRLAAMVLLVASPAIGGIGVDAAHPCPEKAPWTVEAANHASHSTTPADHHTSPTERHDCKCVGTCQATPAVRSVDAAQVQALVAADQAVRIRPVQSALLPVLKPGDRLPPATAPPLV